MELQTRLQNDRFSDTRLLIRVRDDVYEDAPRNPSALVAMLMHVVSVQVLENGKYLNPPNESLGSIVARAALATDSPLFNSTAIRGARKDIEALEAKVEHMERQLSSVSTQRANAAKERDAAREENITLREECEKYKDLYIEADRNASRWTEFQAIMKAGRKAVQDADDPATVGIGFMKDLMNFWTNNI